ncbi:MAG: LPS assembly protein LptD [Thermodesulfobacteriota bacterium]|nr:LPS assembly protein LptD [Thermodesulfobacteriota bacterium]
MIISVRTVCIATSIWLLFFSAGIRGAVAQDGDFFSFDKTAPWHIEADTIRYDKQTGEYVAAGSVELTRQGKTLTADRVRFDQNTRQMVAQGHVVMTAGSDILMGQRMEMDMSAETGVIHQSTVFLAKNHFYIQGDKIRKTGPESYAADRISLTSCDPESPDWHISGRNLDITIEGYGSLWHAALWAKKAPVFYTPYLFFPVKIERQTGFLVPRISYSESKWEVYEQPFYWAINDSADLTLYDYHMGRRGEKLGFEYRQVFDANAHLTLMADGFKDRKINTEGGPILDANGEVIGYNEDEYGYSGDEWLRSNTDRYWVRGKYDHLLPGGVNLKMDVDVVSDQDYLKMFQDGYTGFEAADEYFEETFGRDLDDDTATTRTSSLALSRSWSAWNLNAEFQWNDNVINRRWLPDMDDTTVQRLPVVELDATKSAFLDTPFYYTMENEYLYGYRDDGVRGHRLDLYPRVYLPFQLGHYLSIEPSAGIRETTWQVDRFDRDTHEDRHWSREIYDTEVDVSTEFYRVFQIDADRGTKLKHAIVPGVVHTFIPHEDQDEYPGFDDDIDQIAEENRVTYSITNSFMLKKPKFLSAGPVNDPADSPFSKPAYDYIEICRLMVEQSYDINEARDDDPDDWKNKEERQPFSSVLVELDITPSKYFKFEGDAEWSQYSNDWETYNAALDLSDSRGDNLLLEYRYALRRSETIYSLCEIALTDNLKIYADNERNLYNSIDIKTRGGFLYESGCWSLDLMYTKEPDERQYSIMLTLNGLGELGTEVSGKDFEEPRVNEGD